MGLGSHYEQLVLCILLFYYSLDASVQVRLADKWFEFLISG